ncbi:hypothetical protein ACHHYP_11630 [Achlya hypogyna]|uniref:Serine/threonine-protein phosphatase n=1 Tax=Achlya hypogyna TaxID=1202772 RepID=A0A1V9YIX1_ACHHY|nr:hypothetical protein ACHHYP_11630 [Achlya hypogyna]
MEFEDLKMTEAAASPLSHPRAKHPRYSMRARDGDVDAIQKQHLLEIQRLREQMADMQVQMQALVSERDQAIKERVKKPARSVAPSMFSVTDEGTKERHVATGMGRHVSIATDKILRAIPKQIPNRVAARVSEAFTNPLKAIQYLNSYEFNTDLLALAQQAATIFENEARCVALESPVYVFGDIHGNLADLKFFSENLWRLGMGLTAGSFLFLGDYVDRGLSSLECVAYLFAQKIMHPNKVVLLRGNHETRAVNGWEEHYGIGSFLAQCKKRFGNDEGCIVWHQINSAFDRMPVAAVIDDDIFCAHGGIPRPIDADRQVDSIQNIPHFAPFDVLGKGAALDKSLLLQMAEDLMWADPVAQEQEAFLDKNGFGKSVRGGSAVCFGSVAIEDFLGRHNFSYIVRAHEACTQGVAISKAARVLTVFSTSKDHGLGKRAKCGCLLVDRDRIVILNRSHKYKSGFVRRRSSAVVAGVAVPSTPPAPLTPQRPSAVASSQQDAGSLGSEDEESTDDEGDDAKELGSATDDIATPPTLHDIGDNNQEEA